MGENDLFNHSAWSKTTMAQQEKGDELREMINELNEDASKLLAYIRSIKIDLIVEHCKEKKLEEAILLAQKIEATLYHILITQCK